LLIADLRMKSTFKKQQSTIKLEPSRGEWIRTIDLFVPNEARYQLRYTPPTDFVSIREVHPIVKRID
jgi:hypothetical protein